MKLTTDLKKIIVTGVKIVAIVEIVYLVVLNLALQLPVTQSLVNAIKPDKFHVSWETAWTWYPFRLHARGVSANGQSRAQQWQLDAVAASGSIAISGRLGSSPTGATIVAQSITSNGKGSGSRTPMIGHSGISDRMA